MSLIDKLQEQEPIFADDDPQGRFSVIYKNTNIFHRNELFFFHQL